MKACAQCQEKMLSLIFLCDSIHVFSAAGKESFPIHLTADWALIPEVPHLPGNDNYSILLLFWRKKLLVSALQAVALPCLLLFWSPKSCILSFENISLLYTQKLATTHSREQLLSLKYSCGEAGRSVEGMILVNMLGFLEGWQGC